MLFSIPVKPSPRNIAIYQEVVDDLKTQSSVANAYGVSQPQISRIVKQVQKWLVRQRAFDDDMGTEESLWLANHKYVRKLLAIEQKTLDAFDNGLDWQRNTKTMKGHYGGQKETVDTKKGKGDPRYLMVYCKIAKEVRDGQIAEVKAKDEMVEKLRQDHSFVEDDVVRLAMEHVDDARLMVKQLVYAGHEQFQLPDNDLPELAAYAHRAFRADPTLGPLELLPDAWQMAILRLRFDIDVVSTKPTPLAPPARMTGGEDDDLRPHQWECEGDVYEAPENGPLCMDNEEAHDDVNAMRETLCADNTPSNQPELSSKNRTHNSPVADSQSLPKAG
jgi:hypothetical protein